MEQNIMLNSFICFELQIYNLREYSRYSWIYLPSIEAVTKKYFPPGTRTIDSLHRNTALLLSNTNNALGYARPNMPNVIEIGGIHCRAPLPLPSDLEEFISGSGEHGIIYISFGSSIRSKFPDYITQAIVRVLRRLPQRILWKWNEDISDLPSNVMMSKWFPQQDVLGISSFYTRVHKLFSFNNKLPEKTEHQITTTQTLQPSCRYKQARVPVEILERLLKIFS